MIESSTGDDGTLEDWVQYWGDGKRTPSLPAGYQPASGINNPTNYIADQPLRDAVNVALALRQPLLVTGEPGTGKSQLAWSLAFEMGQGAPLVFHTKSTSVASDLFYRYDALRRFHDVQSQVGLMSVNLKPEGYVTYEPFGLAIMRAADPHDKRLPIQLQGDSPRRLVVLIDEVDKAPRDFPNDILSEIEDMAFEVGETGERFEAPSEARPIVIMTSNSEKDLPDAFLRRCVYYHIPFPRNERLLEILSGRIPRLKKLHAAAVAHFGQIRALTFQKPPATAELISWVRVLDRWQVTADELKSPKDNWAKIKPTYSVILKNEQDIEVVRTRLGPGASRVA